MIYVLAALQLSWHRLQYRTPTQAQNTSKLYLVGFEEAASFLDSAGLDVLEGVAGADEPVGKESSILAPRS